MGDTKMKKILLTIILLSFLITNVSATTLNYKAYAVNLGDGFLDESYWNLTTPFNVFTLSIEDNQYSYVALYSPEAHIQYGTEIINIVKVNKTNEIIKDAIVLPNRYLLIATNNGLYKSTYYASTVVHWLNDTTYFIKLDTGNYERLRASKDYAYALSGNIIKRIDYNTYIPSTLYTINYGDVKDIFVSNFDDVYAIAMTTGDASEPRRIYKNGVNIFNVDSASNEDYGGSLHVNDNEDVYWSGWQSSGTYKVHNSTSYIKDWFDNGQNKYPIYKGHVVFGINNNIGIIVYNTAYDASGSWYIVTFSTDFNQASYKNLNKDNRLSGNIYSEYDNYYNNQKFTINYNMSYFYNETDNTVSAIAYLIDKYKFKIELEQNNSLIGEYDIPESYSAELHTVEGSCFLGIFCDYYINVHKEDAVHFQKDIGLWDEGDVIVYLYDINKTDNKKYLIDSDKFTVVNQSYNITTGLPDFNEGETYDSTQSIQNLLNSKYFWALMFIMLGLGAGAMLNSQAMLFGGGAGVIFAYLQGLLPVWVLFLFAILIFVSFANILSKNFTGD
jgi:hypothetical protein